MKVCFLVGFYQINRGGAEYQSYLLAQELKKNHEIIYISIGQKSESVFTQDGFKIYTLKTPKILKRNAYFLLYRKIKKIFEMEFPDAIYQRVAYSATGFAAHWAHKNAIKFIWHISSDNELLKRTFNFKKPEMYIEQLIKEYGIKMCEAIIAQTEDQAKLLERNFGKKTKMVCPNFHPVSHERITKSRSPLRIAWVANIKPIKQPQLFLDLARRFCDRKNVEFIMIGRLHSGRFSLSIKKRIENTENLRYLGELPVEGVNVVLTDCHLLINTSVFEGFSNTFIQAWLKCVPVLSLNVNPDHLFEKHGIGLCAGNWENLVQHLDFLLSNPEVLEKLGKQGRLYAEKYHSLKNIEIISEILTS